MNTKNEGALDRLIRILIGEVLLLSGFFWLWGTWQIIAYALGVVAVFTAFSGFCLLYKLLGISTNQNPLGKASKIFSFVLYLLIIILPVVGSYYSNFFTKKIFLEDYSKMNEPYKQTLFFTGQDKRQESKDNYQKLVLEFEIFSKKYSAFHPYIIRKDAQFNNDLKKVSQTITKLSDTINTGNLKDAHLTLETVRPVFQDILKRNNFSMLAVSLVDFHDSMEVVIAAADKKDSAGVISAYADADAKLKAVEAESNDSEIQTIRQKLEETLSLAKEGKADSLSAKAGELKSAFVKVYLKRG